jgi:hypothetical protein
MKGLINQTLNKGQSVRGRGGDNWSQYTKTKKEREPKLP